MDARVKVHVMVEGKEIQNFLCSSNKLYCCATKLRVGFLSMILEFK